MLSYTNLLTLSDFCICSVKDKLFIIMNNIINQVLNVNKNALVVTNDDVF